MLSCNDVERKLDLEEDYVQKIYQRTKFVGKGDRVLPHLHEILALCTSCFDKMNTEAARLGIIKRKL